MKKNFVSQYKGRMVQVAWRDPETVGGWEHDALKTDTALVESIGWIVGKNRRKEVVIASTRSGDQFADATAIPTALIESIVLLAPMHDNAGK